MAYEKTTWASGDVVTSDKLNNIENGIAGAAAKIYTEGTLSFTEISAALAAGQACILPTELPGGVSIAWAIAAFEDSGEYILRFMTGDSAAASCFEYSSASPDGPWQLVTD